MPTPPNKPHPALPTLAHRSLTTVLNLSQALLVASQILITPTHSNHQDQDVAKQFLDDLFTELTMVFVAKLGSLGAVDTGVVDTGVGGKKRRGERGMEKGMGMDKGRGRMGMGNEGGGDGGDGSNGGSAGADADAEAEADAVTDAEAVVDPGTEAATEAATTTIPSINTANKPSCSSSRSSSSSTTSHLSTLSDTTQLSAGSADIHGIGSGGSYLVSSVFPETLTWSKLQALLLRDRELISKVRGRRNYSARLSEEEVAFIRTAALGLGNGVERGVEESVEVDEAAESAESGESGESTESGKPEESGKPDNPNNPNHPPAPAPHPAPTTRHTLLLSTIDQLPSFDLNSYELLVEIGKYLGRHFSSPKPPKSSSSSFFSPRSKSSWLPLSLPLSLPTKKPTPPTPPISAPPISAPPTPPISAPLPPPPTPPPTTHIPTIPTPQLQTAKDLITKKYSATFKGVEKLFDTVLVWRGVYAEVYGVEEREEGWVLVDV